MSGFRISWNVWRGTRNPKIQFPLGSVFGLSPLAMYCNMSNRRKFRSQTCASMDRWEESEKTREEKRRDEKRREEKKGEEKRSEAKRREEKRREEKKREDQKRESEERRCTCAKMLKKWRNTVFFQCFVAPEGPKVGSLKRRVRSHLAGCESKNCTPLWREAHFEDKKLKTHHIRSTFGSWDDGKSARRWGVKHISESKCAKHTLPRTLLEVEMMKKCTPLWREASKCAKHTSFGALLEVEMSNKSTPLWHEGHFQVKMLKTPHVRPLLDVQMSFRVAGARDSAPCQKWAKREGFVAVSRGSAKMHFPWQAQYKRRVHERC